MSSFLSLFRLKKVKKSEGSFCGGGGHAMKQLQFGWRFPILFLKIGPINASTWTRTIEGQLLTVSKLDFSVRVAILGLLGHYICADTSYCK